MSVREIRVGDRPVREVNAEIRAAVGEGRDVLVRDTRSRHNLAVAMPAGARVRFAGNVGYYCAGLNDGARIEIERDAGWGVGEAMARGEIVVGGYAGMSAGASMRGGLIHVKGDAGPRCGVAMKGGDILVEGRIGYLSGFMPGASSRSAAPATRAPTRCGAARSGWPHRPGRSESTRGSPSRTRTKSPRWRGCSPNADSPIPPANGERSFPHNGSGISRAGTRKHG